MKIWSLKLLPVLKIAAVNLKLHRDKITYVVEEDTMGHQHQALFTGIFIPKLWLEPSELI